MELKIARKKYGAGGGREGGELKLIEVSWLVGSRED